MASQTDTKEVAPAADPVAIASFSAVAGEETRNYFWVSAF